MATGTTVSILPCGVGIATETNATMVFGHDPDQIKQLRTAPEGSYW